MKDIPSSSNLGDLPGRIRKRRFSTARIQPTRIKKVMQSDEEIGRMIASVPVAVGSAMEHFAERLLDTAAHIMHGTLNKTLSPHHIQQAIRQTPYFAFLAPIVAGAEDPSQTQSPVLAHSMGPSSSASCLKPTSSCGYPPQATNCTSYEEYASVTSPLIVPDKTAFSLERLGSVDSRQVDIKAIMQAQAHSHLAANALKELEAQRQRRSRTAHASTTNTNLAPPALKPKKTPAVEAFPLLDELGKPMKRKRGRPRKDDKERNVTVAADQTAQLSFPSVPGESVTRTRKTPTSPSKPPPQPSDLPSAPANIINGVDRDRELMPPPALPLRVMSNNLSTASTTSGSTISSPSLVVSSKQKSSSTDAILA